VVAPKLTSRRDFDHAGIGISHVFFFAGTSGRYPAAEVVARLFPQSKAFVQRVIGEGLEPASSFPFGPWPDDKLTYRSKNVVVFETPAKKKGIGTWVGFEPTSNPIHGRVRLVEDGVYLLAARLPADMRDFADVITGEVKPVEEEYSAGKEIE